MKKGFRNLFVPRAFLYLMFDYIFIRILSFNFQSYGEFLFQSINDLGSQLIHGDTVSIKQFISLEFGMESL